MGFEGLKPTINKEENKQPITVENNFDNQKKYSKPEIETFHNNIIRDYPQTDEKNLQKVLKKLDIDKGDALSKKGFEVIKKILQEEPQKFSKEKSEIEINSFINFIKNEIDDKTNIETRQEQEKNINNKWNNVNNLYAQLPEENKKIDTKDFEKFNINNKKTIDEIAKKLPKNIKLEDYLKNRYTATQLAKNNEQPIVNKIDFIKSFNELNKALDIDIEIPLFTSESIKVKDLKTDSLDDLGKNEDDILEVKSIKGYVENEEEIIQDINVSDKNVLKIYDKKDLIKKFDKALKSAGQDIDIEKYLNQGQLNTEKLKKEVNQETYDIIVTIGEKFTEKIVAEGKTEIKKVSNKVMKEKIITNVFKGLSSYFDKTNSNEENFAKDFKLNIEDDIGIDGRMVTLNGAINGYYVGFYYDLNTGKLQMDDVVHKDKNNIYQVGKGNGGRFDLPTNLPTYEELADVARSTDINEILSNSDIKDSDTYGKALGEELNNRLSQQFSHKELNKYYIEKYNEKNLAMQETLGYINDNLGGALGENVIDFDTAAAIDIDGKPEQHKLLQIIDDSLDYYSESGQYLQFRAAFEKFNALITTNKIQDPEQGCKEPLINKLFNEDAMAQSAENRKNGGKINYTTFYSTISNDLGIINLGALEKINTVIETDKTVDEFSTAYTDNYKERKADNDLAENLEKLENPENLEKKMPEGQLLT